jgi:hypothetical protein
MYHPPSSSISIILTTFKQLGINIGDVMLVLLTSSGPLIAVSLQLKAFSTTSKRSWILDALSIHFEHFE